jgi:hypothetical protein
MDDDHHHHVNWVRLCLWTAATNGPIVHPPGDIWAWRTMVEWHWQRKTPDLSTRVLRQFYQLRHLVVSKRNGRKEWEFSLEVFVFMLASDLLHAVKSYDMGPPALLPLQRKACCGFSVTLKNPSPWPGLNPRTLGPMASTVPITPLYWIDNSSYSIHICLSYLHKIHKIDS